MNLERKDIFTAAGLSFLLVFTVLAGLYVKKYYMKDITSSMQITATISKPTTAPASSKPASKSIVLRTADNKNLQEIQSDAIIIMAGYMKHLKTDKNRAEIISWLQELSTLCKSKKIQLIIVAPSYDASAIKKASWGLWAKGIIANIYIANNMAQKTSEHIVIVKNGKIHKIIPVTIADMKSKKLDMLFN